MINENQMKYIIDDSIIIIVFVTFYYEHYRHLYQVTDFDLAFYITQLTLYLFFDQYNLKIPHQTLPWLLSPICYTQ
jgi:predicted neutral ceramidase superfamily lipid hydrolase